MQATFLRIGTALALACAIVPAASEAASIATAHTQTAMAARGSRAQAEALLDRAIVAYVKQGSAAFDEFSKPGGLYSQGDLYVVALGTDGVLKATANNPQTLVGQQVLEVHDAAGNPVFRNLIDASADKGNGVVNYIWRNPVTNHVENKTALVQRVGDTVLAVGYYTPRSTAEQAHAFLNGAYAEVERVGAAQAWREFNDPKGEFVRNDLYVFAIGLKDARYLALGSNPKLVGKPVANLRDASGKPIVAEMISTVNSQGAGYIDYIWRNPVTNKVENKTAYVRRAGDALIGVGYYRAE
ncbi:cache domain-containing protein [Derxia gummosa]|uniref:Cache domain-containing protein n=1 Tax=Derxia gummosa DSM 723 TaxID=1121388 RepID=A0A8B6X1A2_9BURK|nr:cache domain-containing protein [Derxia gummosa]